MSYRVTNSMMQRLMLNDMHTNLSKLLDVQQQMSTQRKYQYASDNPNAVTKGMSLETMITETEQYIKNLQDAVSWLNFTDSALGDMNDVFHRIRELAIYAANGALEGTDLGAIAEELKQLKEELRNIANSTIAGEYLFSGLKTDTIPFTIGEDGNIVYNGNNYSINWEFSQNSTGKVSVTGNQLYPENETTHYITSIEVPLDFEWTGRSEILEFNVGWQTVKVRIPERWMDESADGIAASSDYNRFRDDGELDGYSLQEIADLINNSTEMGDVSKLLKATVVTDSANGVQYLKLQSLTGEPVAVTSWPETDAEALSQGIKGAAYGPTGRVADDDGLITITFMDRTTFSVSVSAGDTLEVIAKKLSEQQEGRIWAAYKSDGTNEWIEIVARETGQSFSLTTTGGATSLFATESVADDSSYKNGSHTLASAVFDAASFETISSGALSFEVGGITYTVDIPANSNLAAIESAINGLTDSSGTQLFNADASAGALVITSLTGNTFNLSATGGVVPLYSDGVSASSSSTTDADGRYTLTTSALTGNFSVQGDAAMIFEYNGVKYTVPLAANSPLATVANDLETAMTAAGANAEVKVINGLDGDGNPIQYLEIRTDRSITLSGFGSGATVIGSHTTGSEAISKNADHTHIGFAAMMGLETAVKSTEFAVGADSFDTVSSPLHIKFVCGSNHGEIYIEDSANLTLEDIAKRINSVCGSWLQAVVEVDTPDGADPLGSGNDNSEGATTRLVLRTLDGEPLAIYDGPGKDASNPAGSYAQLLGINTALMGEAATLSYPTSAAGSNFDDNMPAILEVTVGDRIFEVKVCRNNCPTAESVAAAIVRQVNEQYGGTLLAWDANDIANNGNTGTFALYAVTGEPLRVIDKGYGDPRYSEYTGGIAMQLGIAAGVTSSSSIQDSDTFGAGTIRISTPGRTVDVPVLAGDTLHDIANRIKDYAGGWLDISFTSSSIGTSTADVMLSIAAKDGSAVSIFDVGGSVARQAGIDTGLVGDVDLSSFDFTSISEDSMLTITVNGASHTIDLWDPNMNPPSGSPTIYSAEDLANLINTRFQAQDVRAEVVTINGEKRLAIWSPQGYTFEITGTGNAGIGNSIPGVFGFAVGINNTSPMHGGTGPYNQEITSRTGNNQKEISFFGILDNLINCVEGGNIDGISDVMLEQLDGWLTTLLKCRAQAGALESRYTTTIYRLQQNNIGYKDLHSQTVGVDLAEVITEYEMAASIYEASLAAIARLMQPTLLDFLR